MAEMRSKLSRATIGFLLAAATSCAQQKAPAKGNASGGKATFAQYCGLCHETESTEKKLGPGLKGLYKLSKLSTNGKPVNDANVLEKINEGGNGMTPFKDLLSDTDRADLLAYLKTL